MIYILHEDNWEPAMRYEGLACYAYDCGRMEDANAICDASVFDGECIPDLSERGLQIMNGILDQLIQKNNGEIKASLTVVKESLKIGMDQGSCIELIDYIINILKG